MKTTAVIRNRESIIDWQKIWQTFDLVAKKGRNISLSNFVINDRSSRR